MKTLLQMEMYYVREYTPTCRLRVSSIIFKNLQLKCILHYIIKQQWQLCSRYYSIYIGISMCFHLRLK